MGYNNLFLNGRELKNLSLNGRQIWHKQAAEIHAVCFTAEQAGSTVGMTKGKTNPPTVNLEYSTNGTTWASYVPSSVSPLMITLPAVGSKVWFRAGDAGNTRFGGSPVLGNANYFVMTGKIAASGNIMSLIDKNNPQLVELPDAGYNFTRMFQGCEALVTPPELPATTLASFCYGYMFYQCTNLTRMPRLDATTLTASCYRAMFAYCDNLVTVYRLPATVPQSMAYQQMFRSCYSMVDAPEIMLTSTLANLCSAMFNGCVSLRSVRVHFTTWTSNATSSWITDTSTTGTFYCPAALPDVRGNNNIPNGWTKADI